MSLETNPASTESKDTLENFKKEVIDKLSAAYATRVPVDEYTAVMDEVNALYKQFMSGKITLEVFDAEREKCDAKLGDRGVAIFDTISEYSFATQVLKEEEFFDHTEAHEILDHENAHVLAAWEDPSTTYTHYGFRFVTNGTHTKVLPFEATYKTRQNVSDDERRASLRNEISRPDDLGGTDIERLSS